MSITGGDSSEELAQTGLGPNNEQVGSTTASPFFTTGEKRKIDQEKYEGERDIIVKIFRFVAIEYCVRRLLTFD